MAKFKVGDRVRTIGKNIYYPDSVQFTITEVRDSGTDTSYRGDPLGWGVWEDALELVESTSPKAGDRVRLTPKMGGETVIYGEYDEFTLGREAEYHRIYIESDVYTTGDRVSRSFNTHSWNIEVITPPEPTTEDRLNELAENSYVVHPTDPARFPYWKEDDRWMSTLDQDEAPVSEVAKAIDKEGYEIVYEGVKDA